jgi:hypothetical protein
MEGDLRVIRRLYTEHIEGLGIAFFIAVREQDLTIASGVVLIVF